MYNELSRDEDEEMLLARLGRLGVGCDDLVLDLAEGEALR
jgi:hypothetical protein